MTRVEDRAYGILLSDLIESILASAENPVACALHLSERIRSLIGVKTVLVYEWRRSATDHGHALLSVTPERRRSFGTGEVMAGLLRDAYHLPGIMIFRPANDSIDADAPTSPTSSVCTAPAASAASAAFVSSAASPKSVESRITETLDRIKAGLSILVPLQYTERQMGLLVLLDIMDDHNLENLVMTLAKLSGIMALVLRNAMLYAGLEALVEERTTELQAERTRLLKALEEKQVLFKEVHHRVKNNLQIIDSLLFLQSEQISDPAIRQALADSRGRITAMAMVHAELYQADDLTAVDMTSYIPRLVTTIMAGATGQAGLDMQIDELSIPLEKCIPCGLIINEIVTNAIKYAFRGQGTDRLYIKLGQRAAGLCLVIADNGPGLPPAFEPEQSPSLGMTIVRSLAGQLGGTVDWLSDGGLRFELRFEL
jgi:two-component sensor histidine kinase